MGLDTTHDCWHGPYGAFNNFRRRVALAINIELDHMEGFKPLTAGDEWEPILWEHLEHRPAHEFLMHSDCEGEIPADRCGPIADDLQEICDGLPVRAMYDDCRPALERFIAGLRLAQSKGEAVGFH